MEELKILRRFTEFSGLKMNNDKIQQKLASTIFKEDELLLDPGIFRILVIKFSTNTELVNEINHEDRLIERITILNV